MIVGVSPNIRLMFPPLKDAGTWLKVVQESDMGMGICFDKRETTQMHHTFLFRQHQEKKGEFRLLLRHEWKLMLIQVQITWVVT